MLALLALLDGEVVFSVTAPAIPIAQPVSGIDALSGSVTPRCLKSYGVAGTILLGINYS